MFTISYNFWTIFLGLNKTKLLKNSIKTIDTCEPIYENTNNFSQVEVRRRAGEEDRREEDRSGEGAEARVQEEQEGVREGAGGWLAGQEADQEEDQFKREEADR